jgi:hypothetical protein
MTGEQGRLFEFEAPAEPSGPEILPALLEDLPDRQLPKSVNKANAAITVFPVSGRYSLVQRRLFNALNALARTAIERLDAQVFEQALNEAKVVRFEASTADLRRLVGWAASNATDDIEAALDALQALKVIWDSVDAEGTRTREHATLLGQWGLSVAGRVTWQWMPDVFRLLFHPKSPWTPLDLALTRRFGSRYTLALYENTFRYRRTDQRVTPWRSVRDWVLLLCGPDRYSTYKEFKRTVLKRAISEMDKTPECPIRVELEEETGARGAVRRLRFRITAKAQAPLPMEMPADIDPGLLVQMRQLGVRDATCRALVNEYDEAYLQRQLALTQRQLARRANSAEPVANPAGLFVRAVRERYADEVAQAEARAEARLAHERKLEAGRQLRAQWQAARAGRVLEWFEQGSAAERDALVEQFHAQTSKYLRRLFERHGLQGKAFRASFANWLADRPGILVEPELLSFEAFAAARVDAA